MNQMNRAPLIRFGLVMIAALHLTACRDAQDARKAQAAAKAESPSGWVNPHSFDVGGIGRIELEPAASNRPPIQI